MGVRRPWLAGWCLALAAGPALFGAGAAGAQEIQWRTDYAKARQEAEEKERPLVIDVGTEQCYWCKQLDARTFRDPQVVAALNDQCIPLRIDATRHPKLTQALRIQSYPTLVFAAPDGKILGYQEGFVEAGPLREYVQRTVTASSGPPWMAADLKEAARAAGAGDHGRAIGLLKNIVEDGKDRPVQGRARAALEDIERQAAAKLARARQMAEKGQPGEAAEAAQEVVKGFQGSASAREAKALLTSLSKSAAPADGQRARRAQDLLAQAREDYRTQQFACCLDRCEVLAAQFADLPEAAEAAKLRGDITGNPEALRQAAEQTDDRVGVTYLALAESLAAKGQPEAARKYLERVVAALPDTRHAAAARAKLAQLPK